LDLDLPAPNLDIYDRSPINPADEHPST